MLRERSFQLNIKDYTPKDHWRIETITTASFHQAMNDVEDVEDAQNKEKLAGRNFVEFDDEVKEKLIKVKNNEEPMDLRIRDDSQELRLQRYKNVYNHLTPLPSPLNEGNKNLLCGDPPNFDKYFSMDHNFRSSNNEDKAIYTLFREQFETLGLGGHYLELGAFDGKTESNTRFFDDCLGWTGLLIEGNPRKYAALTKNRPHAHRMSFAASCSSEEEQQGKTVTFHAAEFTNAGVERYAKDYPLGYKTVDVPCGSLTQKVQDILDGRVHFFSLDVEGSEPSILKHLDFTKVQIDILMVESWNKQCPREPKACSTRQEAREIMKAAGYKLYKSVVHKSDLYIHPDSPLQLNGRRRRLGQNDY